MFFKHPVHRRRNFSLRRTNIKELSEYTGTVAIRI